ncbi:MAG TPA: hypothetical protein PLX59_01500 [Candidatus Cloacimonadota bacterium]|nr:hypothetical protein [Candidatus Cloacimonadota bacterium]
MRCSKAEELIIHQVAGELRLRLKSALLQHLEACPACRAYQKAQTDLNAQLFSATDFPAGLHARIMAEVSTKRAGQIHHSNLFSQKLPVAAALILSLYIGSLVGIKTYNSQNQSAAKTQEEDSTELATFGENSILEDYAYGVENEQEAY